jgi:hypothetical protein
MAGTSRPDAGSWRVCAELEGVADCPELGDEVIRGLGEKGRLGGSLSALFALPPPPPPPLLPPPLPAPFPIGKRKGKIGFIGISYKFFFFISILLI